LEAELPRLHYWAIGPKYKHSNIIRKELFRYLIFAGFKLNRDFVYNKSTKQMWIIRPYIDGEWDVMIEFKSADNPDDLVGEGIHGIVMTEVARMKPTVWSENVLPTITDTDGWVIANTTPKGEGWDFTEMQQLCVDGITGLPLYPEKCDPSRNWVFFHWTYLEQTKISGFIKRVDDLKKVMSKAEFARNFLASREIYEGQVFDGVTEDNCLQQLPNNLQFEYVFGGYDHGHTHRTGITVVGVSKEHKMYVLESIGESGLLFLSINESDRTIVKIIKELQEKYNVDKWFCSHERPENIKALRQYDIDAVSWLSTSNDEGIAETKRTARYLFANMLFQNNLLFYLENQEELKKDLKNVCFKLSLANNSYDNNKIEAKNDDVSDSLTFAVWSYYPLRREIISKLGLNIINEINDD
jgi:hypothetical protein